MCHLRLAYHPNAAILPQKIPFAKFTQGHRPRVYKPDMSTDPWYPFHSCLNFEFAKLALKTALNKEQVNWFLRLIKSIHSTREEFTLNEYNNLQSTWWAASYHMTAPHEFAMYYHSLWDWACDLLKHPNIGPHFPWTADDFWNIQSKLPLEGKVLLFILYADKAKLLSFGWQKGYPVIACLASLPVSIRNGEGIGGGHVVGWLPIVKEAKEHSGKLHFANFKNAVWHESFRKLLQTIEKESETGCWVNCWDGVACHFFPVVLILSADYEEQAVMGLICGIESNFPCPICLIPHDHILEFPDQCTLRTSKDVVKVLQEVHSQDTAKKKEQILIQQGLCDVDSAFAVIANMDIYHALSWDCLHANCAGKFGDHLWVELLRILDRAGHQAMAKVKKNFSEMPCWHMLNHFDEALSISYTDSQKLEDLSKIVVFTCHDVLLQDMDKEGYFLLCCLRAYVEFDLYTALELHMAHTLVVGQEALSMFNILMKKFAEKTDNTKKSWNFPKNHTCMHVFDNIEAKGVTHNFNTKPNEKMHGPLKEKYQKHTNFKNIAQQILDVDHVEAVSELIHCRVADYDAYLLNMEANMHRSEGGDTDDVEQEDFFHIRLGSRVKEPICIQFQANINFKSTTDCHYDCMLLKMQQGDIFGQLIFLFQCVVSDKTFPLALIQPYDAPTGLRLTKDGHLNLWRVHKQPRESAEIFSVHLIIHGALLYLDHTKPGDYFVIDTVNTDMFLRMQRMHKAARHH
ncbi:hypothetical protein EDC04DRAFT_2869958 [Pisolithus marmoratus]|nr:hypothetical protein EDC04DRAFT_2869958 [Pisolithus marmoratus]